MSKTKDELLTSIIELASTHGFSIDEELLDKAVNKKNPADLDADELIRESRVLLNLELDNIEWDKEVLSELIKRYSNLTRVKINNVNSDTDNRSESKEDIPENKNESSKEKEFSIKTNKGDISVRIIKLDEMGNKLFNDKLSSYYSGYKRR